MGEYFKQINWANALYMPTLVLSTFLLLAVANGCGASARPVQQLNQTEKQVARAQAVRADTAPQAAYYLQLAEDQLREAKRLLSADENDLASHFLRRANADAELAEAMAHEAEANAEAEQVQRRLDRIQQNRNPKQRGQ